MGTLQLIAALPYFKLKGIELGPLTLQAWGMFVLAGFVAGTAYGMRMAKKRGLEDEPLFELSVWVAGGAAVFGHLGHALFYDPAHYFSNPIEFLYVWDGLSSFGGLFGCAAICVWFFRKRKLDVLKYGDICAFEIVLGWSIGRLGCSVVHDHIGRPIDTTPEWLQSTVGQLAMVFPDGAAGAGIAEAVRYELGLLDSIVGWTVFGVFLLLMRRPRTPGFFSGLMAVLYGIARFPLDFLRNIDLSRQDARYLGLTPAQFACVLAIVVGLLVIRQGRSRPPWPEAEASK